MQILSYALLIPSIAFLAYLIFRDFGIMVKSSGWGSIFRKEMSLQIIIIPILLVFAAYVSFTDIEIDGISRNSLKLIFAILLAFIISMFWLLYLTWLDIYERENPVFLGLTFGMGCLTVWAVYPLSDLVQSFDFYFNDTFINDFAYSVIGIGLVEELVKFIPWFIILKFTKQINEPYDYLLYASVSALGFAFIENIMYLERTGLTAVYARALYSSVAHMFFSSIIAYGVIWFQRRNVKFGILQFLILWFMAALGHGFYDFWLISVSYRLELATLLFFLITIHLWVVMKNNLINLSTFYDPAIKLRSEIFMYRLINLMLVVLVVAMIGHNAINQGASSGPFFLTVTSNYAYVFMYIVVSFSSFMVIPGYFARFTLPGYWLMPKIIRGPDLREKTIDLLNSRLKPVQGNFLNNLFGAKLKVERRVVFDGDPYWYLTRLDDRVILFKVLEALNLGDAETYKLQLVAAINPVGDGVHFLPVHVQKIGVAAARVLPD